jgi:anti-sigma-K factor RskA
MTQRIDDMTPDERLTLVSLHALHALDAEDAALAEQLIASSPELRAAFDHALETAASLALAPPPADPPAALRARILDAARAERPEHASTADEAPAAPVSTLDAARERRGRRETVALRLFAAAMAAAACVATIFAVMFSQDASDERDRADQADRVAAALATPGASVVPLEGPDGTSGAAVVLASGQEPVLVSTLASAPASRTYQVWAIPDAGGAPRSLGVFEGGDADDVVELPADAFTGGATVAITVEPDGGSPAPTTAPFLLAGV